MASYYSQVPILENLKQNDVLMFNSANNLNFQTPEVQKLFNQGYLASYSDPKTGAAVGVKLLRNYTTPGNLPTSVIESPAVNMSNDQLMSYLKGGNISNVQSVDSTAGMTREEALTKYGSDFTGITAGKDGLFYNTGGAIPLAQKNATLDTSNTLGSYDDRLAEINRQRDERQAQLLSEYQTRVGEIQGQVVEAVQEAKDTGGRAIGTMRRILAKGGGLSGTAAANALITQENVLASQTSRLQQKGEELKNTAYQAYLKGDAQDAAETKKEIWALQDQLNELNQQRIDNFIKLINLQNQQKQMDISTLNALSDIPEGQSIEIGGTTYTGLKKPTKDTQLVKNDLTGESQLIDLQTGDVISTIKGTGASVEQEMVLDMATSYKDAGILPTDSLAQATAKLKGSKVYQQQTRLASSGGGGGSNKGDENLTDFEKATTEAARNVVALEKAGASSSANYWNVVNQFAEAMGIDSNAADRVIINQIRALKGEPVLNPVSVEDSIGSDFVAYNPAQTFISTPEGAKKIQLQNKAEDLRQEAQTNIAIYKNPKSTAEQKKQAKQKLATIPETYNGVVVWNRLMSGV